MKLATLFVFVGLVSGCAPQQEVWNKIGLNQVQLDHDYQECSNLAQALPDVHNQTNIYTSHVSTIGNQTTVTTGPDPYAQLGQNLRDSLDTDERRDAMRRYCMNTKGYNFVGTRPARQ